MDAGMTTMTKGRKAGACAGGSAAGVPITPQEKFVTGVYASLDAAIARELDRLCREEEIIPPCTSGCGHCCRYHILTNSAEAHTLAQYVRREMSPDQLRGLRARTQQWHAWDNSMAESPPPDSPGAWAELSGVGYWCPLLVRGRCSAYPVRPIVCRTYYVRSDPCSCHAAVDAGCQGSAPVAITSAVTVADAHSLALREYIEASGADYSRSMMLLPHWLAIEMGWEFALPR